MDTLFDFPCSPTFRAFEAELLEQHYEAPPETERRQKLLDAMAADEAWMQKQREEQYFEPEPAPRRPARQPRKPREEPLVKLPKQPEGIPLPSGRTTWT